MPKPVPITRRFPGQWCHRSKIWYPDDGLRGRVHGSVQIEGPLHPDVGELLLQLHVHREHVDELMLRKIRSLTRAIKAQVDRSWKVRDVMES